MTRCVHSLHCAAHKFLGLDLAARAKCAGLLLLFPQGFRSCQVLCLPRSLAAAIQVLWISLLALGSHGRGAGGKSNEVTPTHSILLWECSKSPMVRFSHELSKDLLYMSVYIITFLLICIYTCAHAHIFPILIIVSIQPKTNKMFNTKENYLSYKVTLIFFPRFILYFAFSLN